jgi:hypothetical protein
MKIAQQERYWLIAQGGRQPVEGEWQTWDFVTSDCPTAGDEKVPGLEVFTSPAAAEAELRGMDRLEPEAYVDVVSRYGEEFANELIDGAEPSEVVSLSRSELLSMLDSSNLMYVVVDPQPGDQPQSEDPAKLVVLAWEFAEALRG